jgi:hypothetical protein
VFLAPLTGELFTFSSPLRFPKLDIKPSSWDSTFLGACLCKLLVLIAVHLFELLNVVAADGKSRTVTVSGTDSKGTKFTSTAVYDKQ